MRTQQFYSHGKLLLTAEYLVLDGAEALALPTKKGQSLSVSDQESSGVPYIHWKSFDHTGSCWFETSFEFTADGILKTTPQFAEKQSPTFEKTNTTLLRILTTAQQLSSTFLKEQKGYLVTTTLEFPANWGLGSSSTLINNIAQWAGVNAFELLEKSFGGSGYDIACAQHDSPILFTRRGINPMVTKISFAPTFSRQLFFVHLNRKQDSKASIAHYRSLKNTAIETAKKTVNQLTTALIKCTALAAFETLVRQHETHIADTIQTPTIQAQLFADYPGVVKSLGGWGGDFVMATGTIENQTYFKNKGYTTVIPYTEIVL